MVQSEYAGTPAGAGLGAEIPVTYGHVVTGYVKVAVIGVGPHTVQVETAQVKPKGAPVVVTVGRLDTPQYVSVTW